MYTHVVNLGVLHTAYRYDIVSCRKNSNRTDNAYKLDKIAINCFIATITHVNLIYSAYMYYTIYLKIMQHRG